MVIRSTVQITQKPPCVMNTGVWNRNPTKFQSPCHWNCCSLYTPNQNIIKVTDHNSSTRTKRVRGACPMTTRIHEISQQILQITLAFVNQLSVTSQIFIIPKFFFLLWSRYSLSCRYCPIHNYLSNCITVHFPMICPLGIRADIYAVRDKLDDMKYRKVLTQDDLKKNNISDSQLTPSVLWWKSSKLITSYLLTPRLIVVWYMK